MRREAAELLKSLSHPQRLLALCALGSEERSVAELRELLGIDQVPMSQQLMRLRADRLVESRREGTTIYYRIMRPEVLTVIAALHSASAPNNSAHSTVDRSINEMPYDCALSLDGPLLSDSGPRILRAARKETPVGYTASRIARLVMQGAIDVAAWDEGLAAIVDAVRADHLIAILPKDVNDPDARVTPLAWGCGVADENVRALAAYPADVAVLSRLLPKGRMVAQNEAVPMAILSRLAVFEGAIRPMGGYHAAVACTTSGGFVAACRSRSGQPFSDGQKTLLTDLLPMLTTALNLKRHIRLLEDRITTLEATLDEISTGLIFLDAHRQILHANQAGEQVLAHSGLLTQSAMLWGAGDIESQRLARIIDESSGAITLVRRETSRPLAVRAVRMPAMGDRALSTFGATATILFIDDPDRPAPAGISGLCHAFGLTPRETDIVVLLVAGEGPAEIAARLEISLGNVRGHLNRIFGKTGTGSQAQLVALCLSAVH